MPIFICLFIKLEYKLLHTKLLDLYHFQVPYGLPREWVERFVDSVRDGLVSETSFFYNGLQGA